MICQGDWLCIAIVLAIAVPYLPLMLCALVVGAGLCALRKLRITQD